MKKALLIGGLWALVLASLGYATFPEGIRQIAQTETSSVTDPVPQTQEESPVGRSQVRLDRLKEVSDPAPHIQANLFGPLQPRVKKTAAPKTTAPAPVKKTAPVKVAQPVLLPVPERVSKPLPTILYLGRVDRLEQSVVFLEWAEEVYFVRQGETFGPTGQVKLARLTPDRIELTEIGDERRSWSLPIEEEDEALGQAVSFPDEPESSNRDQIAPKRPFVPQPPPRLASRREGP